MSILTPRAIEHSIGAVCVDVQTYRSFFALVKMLVPRASPFLPEMQYTVKREPVHTDTIEDIVLRGCSCA